MSEPTEEQLTLAMIEANKIARILNMSGYIEKITEGKGECLQISADGQKFLAGHIAERYTQREAAAKAEERERIANHFYNKAREFTTLGFDSDARRFNNTAITIRNLLSEVGNV